MTQMPTRAIHAGRPRQKRPARQVDDQRRGQQGDADRRAGDRPRREQRPTAVAGDEAIHAGATAGGPEEVQQRQGDEDRGERGRHHHSASSGATLRGQRQAEDAVLVGVEMHAVHPARRRDAAGVEERAVVVAGHLRQRRRQPGALALGAGELGRDRPARRGDRRRRHDQDRRHRHARLDRRAGGWRRPAPRCPAPNARRCARASTGSRWCRA